MKNDKWSEKEIKILFKEIEKAAAEKASKRSVFDAHAFKFLRSNFAVKNFYYSYNKKVKLGKVASPLLGFILTTNKKPAEPCCVNNSNKNAGKVGNKVLTMPQKQLVSDGEINALFLGLVKMVKNVAKAEAEGEIVKLCKEVSKKNKQLRIMLEMNLVLKRQVEGLLLKLDETKDSVR